MGSRTGALGSPPVAEKIDAAQLPRPPEQPPVLAAACPQENGADSGCQAKDIAPDTLPRPPEKLTAALTADALDSIAKVCGDEAPEDPPPGLLETAVATAEAALASALEKQDKRAEVKALQDAVKAYSKLPNKLTG